MANCMKKVAEMLGVELREKFKVVFRNTNDEHVIAMLTDYGLLINCKPNCIPVVSSAVLESLLTDNAVIEHLFWKPQDDNLYYYVSPQGDVYSNVWGNYVSDINMYKLGNCYRTAQAAEINRDKWIAFYNSDEAKEA